MGRVLWVCWLDWMWACDGYCVRVWGVWDLLWLVYDYVGWWNILIRMHHG